MDLADTAGRVKAIRTYRAGADPTNPLSCGSKYDGKSNPDCRKDFFEDHGMRMELHRLLHRGVGFWPHIANESDDGLVASMEGLEVGPPNPDTLKAFPEYRERFRGYMKKTLSPTTEYPRM